MSTRRDRLAEQLVESALDLHGRRPWRDVPADTAFLVRIPTEDLPLAAVVMGQAGEEYGLILVRGEGAFRRLARFCSGHAVDFADAADLLSLTFERWRAVPDEFRRLPRAAGLQPQRERVVPMAFAKRPYQLARPPGRGDQRTLLWVVRGVLAAHEAGELRPPSAASSAGVRVLAIEVSGEPREPTVTARLVPRPEDADALDPPALVALPADLADLPRRDERWLVGRAHMAAEIRGDEREVFGVLVVEEKSDLILGHGLALGDELAPVVEVLAKAFRGGGGRRGLPRAIVFESPWLCAAFTPALAGLGIEAVLDEDCEVLGELSAELGSELPDPAEVELPQALLQCKAIDAFVAAELAEEVLDKGRATDRAKARYFGTAAAADEVLEELEHYGPFGAFVEWLAADYRATRRSKTLVEKRLEKKRLDPALRALLEARRDAVLSIFRVDALVPGVSIDVEDVLSGERYTVHDRALSGLELEGVLLPLRLLQVQDWIFPALAGPPLAPVHAAGALEVLEHHGAELTAAGLRRDAHLVGRLWPWVLAFEAPVMSNTDGDPLELQTATFLLADPPAFGRTLMERDDLDHDPENGRWIWWRGGAPGGGARRTLLATIEILDDRLVVEVNSTRRLERVRAWLEALPGIHFERASVHGLEPSQRPLDDRLPAPPSEPPEPELLERVVREQVWRWLDESVPALGGLTPREACATEDGRRRVARLVRTMPAIQTPNGPIEVPREELLGELGISSKE